MAHQYMFIAKTFAVFPSTVSRAWKRFQSGSYSRRAGQGRRRSLSHQDWYLLLCERRTRISTTKSPTAGHWFKCLCARCPAPWSQLPLNTRTGRSTTSTLCFFLEDETFDIIDWPSCSPDLHPIEHLWDIMFLPGCTSGCQELSDPLVQIWEEIGHHGHQGRLARSMSQRLDSVLIFFIVTSFPYPVHISINIHPDCFYVCFYGFIVGGPKDLF